MIHPLDDYVSFMANNGLLIIAGGAAMGTVFTDLVSSMVDDVFLPITFKSTRYLLPVNVRQNLFNDKHKNGIQWISVLRVIIVFMLSTFVIYIVAGIILSNAISILRLNRI
jgi:large-conductance mechanosensitive channel